MNGLYDPLTYENLMAGLVVHFERQSRLRPGDIIDAPGPGIYALFYCGDFEPYVKFAGTEQPIYVGKAIPPGSREGADADESVPALQRRLKEHARSLTDAQNLLLADFECRYLSLVPVWISLAERFLIDHYQPLWNLRLDGFGNHNPGSGRRQGETSWWDTLHPGRAWAKDLRHVKTQAVARDRVSQFSSNAYAPGERH